MSWSLSPQNPLQETTSLVHDVLERGEQLGVELPLTQEFLSLFKEIRTGQRKTGWGNLEELEQSRLELGIEVP